MGRRGPKPKPTAIRKLEGNPSRREFNANEPVCERLACKPSVVGMDQLASAEWDRLLSSMPPGIYTALDEAAIAQYALAWSALVKAQKSIDEHGLMVETKWVNEQTGEIVVLKLEINPAFKAWKAASESLIKLTDRLGLTPGVRSRLQLPSRNAQPQSKFAGLLAGQTL